MGLDITVIATNWARMQQHPAGQRLRAVAEAACWDDWESGDDEGWIWPPEAGAAWCVRFEFRMTMGSYKPHFWAGEAWDLARLHAAPGLREPLDSFLSGLIWLPSADPEDDHTVLDRESFAQETYAERLLVARPPETVPDLARAWSAVRPLLGTLREPFGEHAACPGRWMADFEEFSELLHGWGEVVGEAGRRGWGVLGLPI
ncbi:hypothetical protein [Streptomyces rimosus]|uniref:hypothetical protein n=1 Tax=Streptomyces rimosus TaxID=1927 RepID=UPI0037A26280